MQNKIIITKENRKLNFYLLSREQRLYLFTQDFSKGVYNFFRNGKTENQLRSYDKWNNNKRLDKTIEKIPMYVRYVLKEVAY